MAKVQYKLRATIRSFTDPKKKYTIKQKENGQLTCNCPAWIFNHSGDRKCKHINAILKSKDPIEKMIFASGKYVLDVDGSKWTIEEDK